jgi:hypothetical protein
MVQITTLHRGTCFSDHHFVVSEPTPSLAPNQAGADGSEIIKQRISPGGILRTEICVLDDISRAPGEALNVLLVFTFNRC